MTSSKVHSAVWGKSAMLSTLLALPSLQPLPSWLIFYFFLLFVSLLFFHHEGKCMQRGQAEEKWNEWEGNLKEKKMKRKR